MEKQYDHKAHEQLCQQLWDTKKTYIASNNSGPLYSVDTPPPTVSGSLHLGHIFSYTQTDIVVRYQRMNGHSVFYPFGFDDNGLATERFVEKKLNITAHSMPRSEFIALCLKESHNAEEQFKSLWQRMGLSVDWDACYSTISDPVRKISQESFIRLLEKGYIYRKNEPALYCTTCRTSVAQAELDDKEEPSFFNDIIFKDAQGNDLVIGTTRPELLPSCVALLYNPADIRYQHLQGTVATTPLFNVTVPVIADEKVEIEKGTGLVMCCTFGDKTDIEWYKKHNLPYRQSIGFDGRFVPGTPIIEGLKVPQAREAIITALKNGNLLINQRSITHAVNIHERCKKEIEYMMLAQWFLNILDYKKELIALADTIEWYPSYMKVRYQNWVENLSWDWCLSRQRFYGIPFPVWHCIPCGAMKIAALDQLPVDPQEQQLNVACERCGGAEFKPDTDVMDTWNTSSITPYICASLYNRDSSPFDDAKKNGFIPMGMRPQAHDIIRTWAFYTIVKSWMHDGIIPWKSIVISGHVLSAGKEKLSKSQNNAALTPEGLLSTHSADAIRFWTASGSLGTDIAFSDTQLKIGQRLVTKLWNAFRFLHEHLTKKTEQKEVAGVLNRWILDRASRCFESYQNYFSQNEFSLALNAVEQFFWKEFCDNYVELVKDQLFHPEQYDAAEVASTKATLYELGLRILQLYAPYIPHVTETLYGTLYKKDVGSSSLHQIKFDLVQTQCSFTDDAILMGHLITIVEHARRLKSEKQLSLKAPIASLEIMAQDEILLNAIKKQEQLLKGVIHAAQVSYRTAAQPTALSGEQDDLRMVIGLEG